MIQRVGTVAVSAASLRDRHGIHFVLEDGGGIGEVLVGKATLEGVGEVWFECPHDPTFEMCAVYAGDDLPDAIDEVCLALEIDRELIVRKGR